FSGYRPYVFKMLVFGLSGAIAGLAGMLYAPQMNIFTPTNLEPKESIGVVIFVAVGGRATLSGPIFGALAVSYLYSWLTSNSAQAWPLVLGLLFVMATLYLPRGVMGIWQAWLSLPLSKPHSSEQESLDIPELTSHQKRGDLLIAVAGFLTLAVGLYASFSLWDYAKPYDDGLMAQSNGSSVVTGLILVLAAVCATLQIPAGMAILAGRSWGLAVSRRTLAIAAGLTVTAIGWTFFIETFRDGITGWTLNGARRAVTLLTGAPALPVLGLWSVTALVFFGKAIRSQRSRDTAADESTTPEGADETQNMAAAAAEREERLQRIAARQRGGPVTSLLDSPLLTVEKVSIVFDGFKALDVDEFSVGHYDLNVIIGPNGAGKTTLCDAISGKTRPTRGRITFAGQDITELPEADIARMGVGRKFQTPTVFDSLTVFQNMELALPGRDRLVHNIGDKPAAKEHTSIETILRRVNLLEHSGKEVRYLSHGQRQWLEISMLILSGPRLLLVDEPAAGLT
ncbi:MAG: ATP-binding cassette domain-containing protein, partial [Planctomycetaceae bacterium]